LSLAPFRSLFESSRGAAGLVRDAAESPSQFLKEGFEWVLGDAHGDNEEAAEAVPRDASKK
jgi:hypothetical protein